jgi:hypothetical protein
MSTGPECLNYCGTLTEGLVAHIEIVSQMCVVVLSGDEEPKSGEDFSMDALRLLILAVNFGRTFYRSFHL